jgi:bifunctional NMN adenylyltransferase/nudix hydrolase
MVQNATVLLANVAVVGLSDLTNENDICTEWGDYVLKHAIEFTGQKPDLIIHGDDGRASDPIHWFNDKAKVGIHFLMVPRNFNSISGTRQRELIMFNAYIEWCKESPDSLHPHFDYMREHLLAIPHYQEKYKPYLGVERS